MGNLKLSLAMLASMNNRALGAAIASGALSKADVVTINALRLNGRASEVIGEHVARKVVRDYKVRKVQTLIGQYAHQRAGELLLKEIQMPSLLEQNIAKARETQSLLRKAISDYQAKHPGCNRADAIDAVLLSPEVGELHKAERRLAELELAEKLGGGNLWTPPPGAMVR